jgi:hypothetical protein
MNLAQIVSAFKVPDSSCDYPSRLRSGTSQFLIHVAKTDEAVFPPDDGAHAPPVKRPLPRASSLLLRRLRPCQAT